jgi:Spy/CpxP family protein refolding chaperone
MNIKHPLKDWTTAITRLTWLCLLFLVSACAPYYQEPPRMGPGPGGDVLQNIERFAPELRLTREQIQKIRQLRANFDREAIRINAALRVAYVDLNNLTHADRKQLDKDKAFKKADEINGLHAQMQRKIIELDLGVTDLLTDDQYEKFRDILSRRSRDY